jgi:DNA (cytosine-5)-methyltransferase 1
MGERTEIIRNFKVLNLYACLGGNRYKWTDCDVTAVELDPELARLYQERFPNDTVIMADAHQYLLDHYKEFDFIWSSPPCPSHSRLALSNKGRTKSKYPDFKLYEEVVFLQNYFEGKFCVENVIPFYEPLIPAQKRGRHLYWANFNLPRIDEPKNGIIGNGKDRVVKLSKYHNYDFRKYKGKQKIEKIAANLVHYETGRIIYNTARNIITKSECNQITMFE